MVFKDFAIFEESCENGPQKLPKEPPGGQNGAQERLGSAKRGPRGAKRSPRRRQERPKSAPRAAQETSKRSKEGVLLRFRSPGGSGRPPGAILERFLVHFGVLRGAPRHASPAFFEALVLQPSAALAAFFGLPGWPSEEDAPA